MSQGSDTPKTQIPKLKPETIRNQNNPNPKFPKTKTDPNPKLYPNPKTQDPKCFG